MDGESLTEDPSQEYLQLLSLQDAQEVTLAETQRIAQLSVLPGGVPAEWLAGWVAPTYFRPQRTYRRGSAAARPSDHTPLGDRNGTPTQRQLSQRIAQNTLHSLSETATWADSQPAGKYPPAEPGALGIGPLEAATLNPKLCLLGRRTKYALPTSPRSFIQFFATPENRCLLRIASPLDGAKVSRSSVVKLHFVCVVAHDLRFRRWATAVNVKLMLPPRQSRGVSRLC